MFLKAPVRNQIKLILFSKGKFNPFGSVASLLLPGLDSFSDWFKLIREYQHG